MKFIKFLFKLIFGIFTIVGALFTIYITNADSKLVEFIYDKLTKYHANKKVEAKI